MKLKIRSLLYFFCSFAASAFLGAFLAPSQVHAWGGRGHNAICETAVFLVQNAELQQLLRSRPHVMGHLCNIPDIAWRNLAKEQTNEGNPTHFLDTDLLATPIHSIELDYGKIVVDNTGKKTRDGKEIKSVPHEVGSVWWRADQFYRRAVANKDTLASANAAFKLSKTDEQNTDLPYNKAVFSFLTNLGLMGHYVGDASMPFHVTSDYDGYDKGHGGIHSYYEDAIVASFDGDLEHRILIEARKQLKAPRPESFLKPGSVIEKMRALSEASYADIDKVLKADSLVKPSEVKDEGGKKIRTPADRLPAGQNFHKMDALAVKHMARAAVLLSQFWDQAYVDVGAPNFQVYRHYQYPLTPDFVMPDYYEIKAESDTAKK